MVIRSVYRGDLLDMSAQSIPRTHGRYKKTAGWLVWLGLAPLFIFGIAFQLIPIITLINSSIMTHHGLSLDYFQRAFSPVILDSFANSIKLSTTTALLGTILGPVVALAILSSEKKFVRNILTALADVTTNFGGAPLAFAFIITLGSTGVITLVLKAIGINLYPEFRIYSISGLTIAYLYFQLPLMILLIIPSLMGLKNEWWEAAINLGADSFHFWWNIGLPILAPALLSSFLLLFANAFGAYATAWTLTGPDVNLVTVQIASLIRGEVQLEPELANAIAVVSLTIMSLSVVGSIWLGNKARKGQR
jgi:putative spermidine/putrescine transport system permease protein